MFETQKCAVAPGCQLIVRLSAIMPGLQDGESVTYLDASPKTMAYAEIKGRLTEKEFPLHITASIIDAEVKLKAYEHAGFMLRPQGVELFPFEKLVWSDATDRNY